MRQVVEDVKAFTCAVAYIEALTIGKFIEVCIAQLHTLHLFQFGVVRTLVSMGVLQYLKRMAACHKGLIVISSCLVLGVAVLLAEITAHHIVYLYDRELRVYNFKVREVTLQLRNLTLL